MTEKRKMILEKRERQRKECDEYLEKKNRTAIPNRKSCLETIEAEQQANQELIENTIMFTKNILPTTLRNLSKIPDYRNPIKVKHAMPVLMIYGIIGFICQLDSRRQANREITAPIIVENLKTLFPEFTSMPHADTLARVLEEIDVSSIEAEAGNIINRFIRKKKFVNLLIAKGYAIAIDGTGKFTRDRKWAAECLEKTVGKSNDETGEEKKKYFCYVVEACFVFYGGLTLPFMSEFLEYSPEVTGNSKQDCETNGFKRLVARIKQKFPKLKITVLADGLFATGPTIKLLNTLGWGYMIGLKDDSLKSVWHQFNENMNMEKDINTWTCRWGNREQVFYWSNEIDYKTEINGEIVNLELNIVVCEETWEELKIDGTIDKKYAKFSWISSKTINKKNVVIRCNCMARIRWAIESNILVEKHYGYSYEHCFSYNWNAMKGYHYLMHIAHIINSLMFRTEYFHEKIKQTTMTGMISLFKRILQMVCIDKVKIAKILGEKHNIRFA